MWRIHMAMTLPSPPSKPKYYLDAHVKFQVLCLSSCVDAMMWTWCSIKSLVSSLDRPSCPISNINCTQIVCCCTFYVPSDSRGARRGVRPAGGVSIRCFQYAALEEGLAGEFCQVAILPWSDQGTFGFYRGDDAYIEESVYGCQCVLWDGIFVQIVCYNDDLLCHWWDNLPDFCLLVWFRLFWNYCP